MPDRTVLITGAAGGIGAALVSRFLDDGYRVIAADLSAWALEAHRSSWSQHPAGTFVLETVDVSSPSGIAALAAGVSELDVLVNCAGYFPQTSFEDMAVDEWQRVIDINLTGDFLMIKAFLPQLKASGRGRIINVGSGSVFVGTPMQSHYVTSKGGVLGLTRTLARELGGYGITVNLVTPGLTVTPAAVAVLPPSLLELQRSSRALQRDEVPEDVVGPVAFLASDDAAFITGQTLNVDGGRYLL